MGRSDCSALGLPDHAWTKLDKKLCKYAKNVCMLHRKVMLEFSEFKSLGRQKTLSLYSSTYINTIHPSP